MTTFNYTPEDLQYNIKHIKRFESGLKEGEVIVIWARKHSAKARTASIGFNFQQPNTVFFKNTYNCALHLGVVVKDSDGSIAKAVYISDPNNVLG